MRTNEANGSGWLLTLVISLLLSLVLGLALVWMSIESTDRAYTIGQLNGKLAERKALKAKLEVERDRLLSPYELGRASIALGMREALPGQIRRLDDITARTPRR
jgi:hypothetical protein